MVSLDNLSKELYKHIDGDVPTKTFVSWQLVSTAIKSTTPELSFIHDQKTKEGFDKSYKAFESLKAKGYVKSFTKGKEKCKVVLDKKFFYRIKNTKNSVNPYNNNDAFGDLVLQWFNDVYQEDDNKVINSVQLRDNLLEDMKVVLHSFAIHDSPVYALSRGQFKTPVIKLKKAFDFLIERSRIQSYDYNNKRHEFVIKILPEEQERIKGIFTERIEEILYKWFKETAEDCHDTDVLVDLISQLEKLMSSVKTNPYNPYHVNYSSNKFTTQDNVFDILEKHKIVKECDKQHSGYRICLSNSTIRKIVNAKHARDGCHYRINIYHLLKKNFERLGLASTKPQTSEGFTVVTSDGVSVQPADGSVFNYPDGSSYKITKLR